MPINIPGNKKSDDLLTVVLLTYNHEKTLSKAFDSILEQQTDFPFRILVLEDCSTDNTVAVCKKYKKKYPEKIDLKLNDKNQGVSVNLKNGLLCIKSKYFSFLEGDDYWCDKEKLQKQIEGLEANSDCSICGHNTFYNDLINNKKKLFVGAEIEQNGEGKYDENVQFRVHPSSRVYRNIIDLKSVPANMLLDTHIFRLYLLEGKFLYLRDVMSVFNNTGKGYWSGRSYWKKRLLTLELSDEANRYFKYKFEKEYLKGSKQLALLKTVLGTKLGWRLFYYTEKVRLKCMCYFENQTNVTRFDNAERL